MNKSVITYTLHQCTKCLKCLRACPTQAITIEKERVHIHHERCINCGRCKDVCLNQGLQAKGSTLYDLQNYDYTIALIPSALYGGAKSKNEVEQILMAIKSLGFDQVIDISDIEASVHIYSMASVKEEQGLKISSHCPCVNRLISMKYPTLYPSLVEVDYPSEVAARHYRKIYNDKGIVGIFYLAECVSKLEFAKYPYGNTHFEVDHALSISDLFPLIKHATTCQQYPVDYCSVGLRGAISKSKDEKGYLNVDGLEKIINILELAEFNVINDVDYLNLNFCFNGCVGGNLLWGNAFLGKNNIKELIKTATKMPMLLSNEELRGDYQISNPVDERSMKEKLAHFKLLNEKLTLLPEYDCGACGFAGCRAMAEAMIEGNKAVEDCKVLYPNKKEIL